MGDQFEDRYAPLPYAMVRGGQDALVVMRDQQPQQSRQAGAVPYAIQSDAYADGMQHHLMPPTKEEEQAKKHAEEGAAAEASAASKPVHAHAESLEERRARLQKEKDEVEAKLAAASSGAGTPGAAAAGGGASSASSSARPPAPQSPSTMMAGLTVGQQKRPGTQASGGDPKRASPPR